MAKAAQEDETLELPEGGIAAFVMSDEDADEIYGPDEDGTEEFGEDGIAQFPALTKKMAAMGREGDDTIAHVQTGELIIPAAFLEANPEMKETLFAFLEGQGVEDPEQYVVGSDENSINPDTVAPEFFFKFIKKAIKGVVKGVKNVIKGVVKVVKKIAPIVLPIVLGTFGPLGAIYGSALGSGIGTLISGGSLKDALKAGVMTGLTGGLIKGATGMLPGGQGFFKTIGNELAAPGARFAQLGQGISNTAENLFSAGTPNSGPGMFSDFNPAAAVEAGRMTPEAAKAFDIVETPKLEPKTTLSSTGTEVPEVRGFGESIKDAFTPGGKGFGESLGDAFLPKGPAAADFLGTNVGPEAAKLLAEKAAPGFLRSYAPIAAAGTLVGGALGAFEVPEQEDAGVIGRDEDGNPITGSTLVEDDPSKYLISDLGNIVLNPETGQYEAKTTYRAPDIQSYDATAFQMSNENPFAGGESGIGAVSTATGPFARPTLVQNVAEGGQIFPRRTGGIMPNEGVPNQDSVRAMLMPGEFVMTTDAVKGMGNGNMQQGIQNMYSIMSNLENRGRQTA